MNTRAIHESKPLNFKVDILALTSLYTVYIFLTNWYNCRAAGHSERITLFFSCLTANIITYRSKYFEDILIDRYAIAQRVNVRLKPLLSTLVSLQIKGKIRF